MKKTVRCHKKEDELKADCIGSAFVVLTILAVVGGAFLAKAFA